MNHSRNESHLQAEDVENVLGLGVARGVLLKRILSVSTNVTYS